MKIKDVLNEIRINICIRLLGYIQKIAPFNKDGYLIQKHILNYLNEALEIEVKK
jgi:hypothetical protein